MAYRMPINYGQSLNVGLDAFLGMQDRTRRQESEDLRTQLDALKLAEVVRANKEREAIRGRIAQKLMDPSMQTEMPAEPTLAIGAPGPGPIGPPPPPGDVPQGVSEMTPGAPVALPTLGGPVPGVSGPAIAAPGGTMGAPSLAGPAPGAVPGAAPGHRGLVREDLFNRLGAEDSALLATSPEGQSLMQGLGVVNREAFEQEGKRKEAEKREKVYAKAISDAVRDGDWKQSSLMEHSFYLAAAEAAKDPQKRQWALNKAAESLDTFKKYREDKDELEAFKQEGPAMYAAFMAIAAKPEDDAAVMGALGTLGGMEGKLARLHVAQTLPNVMTQIAKARIDGRIEPGYEKIVGSYLAKMKDLKGYNVSEPAILRQAIEEAGAGDVHGYLRQLQRQPTASKTFWKTFFGEEGSPEWEAARKAAGEPLKLATGRETIAAFNQRVLDEYRKITEAKRETEADRELKAARGQAATVTASARQVTAKARELEATARAEKNSLGGVKRATMDQLRLLDKHLTSEITAAQDASYQMPGRSEVLKDLRERQAVVRELLDAKIAAEKGTPTTEPAPKRAKTFEEMKARAQELRRENPRMTKAELEKRLRSEGFPETYPDQ